MIKNSKSKLILMIGLLGTVTFVPILVMGMFWVTKVKKDNPQIFNNDVTIIRKTTSLKQFKNLIVQRSKLVEFRNSFNSQWERDVVGESSGWVPSNNGSDGKLLTSSPTETNGSSRVSTTNIQVKGVNEPDIVKTNGEQIFWSKAKQDIIYYDSPEPVLKNTPFIDNVMEPKILRDLPPQQSSVTILQAIPPTSVEVINDIKREAFAGELLLDKKTLISLEKGKVTSIKAYDVSEPRDPSLKWKLLLSNNKQLLESRLINGKIYLIMSTRINKNKPCPIPLFVENPVQISCTDIFYTESLAILKNVYTIIRIDVFSGKIDKKVSLVGGGKMNLYVTQEKIYLSETSHLRQLKITKGVIEERLLDVLPKNVLQQINNLVEYNISDQSKELEIKVIIDDWLSSLSPESSRNIESLLSKAYVKYRKDHFRELETTDIVKLNLGDLSVQATGSIPGHVLNQFSFDEYEGNLRVATTSGNRWDDVSESDVYVLDSELKQIGVVTALGKGEQIYAVRFVKNRGYVVTFKQIDPFYILNLDDPTNPLVSGELKIPGFSSYLHPLNDQLILGVGKEKGLVKLSLFNVNDSKKPYEIDKYILKRASWSSIGQNHHAFMLDAQKKVFFIPATNKGYLISYKKGVLSMVKQISEINAERSLYIGDYLYIIGKGGLVVIDENNWQEVKRLEL